MILFPVILFAQSNNLNIFTIGDSNGSFPHSWPKQLELLLPGATVYNNSKSGRTIGFVNNGDSSLNALLIVDEALKKAADFTKERAFDFIVIELGTNDAKAVFANRQNEVPANLDKLLKKIKTCNYPSITKAKIILIAPPPFGSIAEKTEKYKGGDGRVKEMNLLFKEIAKTNGCFFVSGYQTPGLDIETMTDDGIHLNELASRKLMEYMLKMVPLQ